MLRGNANLTEEEKMKLRKIKEDNLEYYENQKERILRNKPNFIPVCPNCDKEICEYRLSPLFVSKYRFICDCGFEIKISKIRNFRSICEKCAEAEKGK